MKRDFGYFVGSNNYSDYDPNWCEGHVCPRDCDGCPYSSEFREDPEEVKYDPFTGRCEE